MLSTDVKITETKIPPHFDMHLIIFERVTALSINSSHYCLFNLATPDTGMFVYIDAI
jgi:hypothetical protein